MSAPLTAERVIGCQLLPIKELHDTGGEEEGRQDCLQPGPPGNYLLQKRKNFTVNGKVYCSMRTPDLPSPHRLLLCAPLRSHQSVMLLATQELFCVVMSSFLPPFFLCEFPQPAFSTCTLDNDFLHFPQPRENRCELVVFSFVFHAQVMSRSDSDGKRTLFFPFFSSEKKGESYPFTDNTTRLLDALYSGPLRVLSVERLLCIPPLLVDSFSPRVTVESLCEMKSLERSALLNNPEGLTPKQDV